MKYKITYGLGGGMAGGTQDEQIIEAPSLDKANEWAWEAACEVYESYAGLHGLRDVSQIMEEEDIDDEAEAQQVFEDERESWLVYDAEEITE